MPIFTLHPYDLFGILAILAYAICAHWLGVWWKRILPDMEKYKEKVFSFTFGGSWISWWLLVFHWADNGLTARIDINDLRWLLSLLIPDDA